VLVQTLGFERNIELHGWIDWTKRNELLSPTAVAVIKVLECDENASGASAIEATRSELDWSKIALQWRAMVTSWA
jgi:hypothetical protein